MRVTRPILLKMLVEVILSLHVISEILKPPHRKFILLNIRSTDSGFNCLGYSNNESVNNRVNSHIAERRPFVGGTGVAKQ
jgi:hypothetical protein